MGFIICRDIEFLVILSRKILNLDRDAETEYIRTYLYLRRRFFACRQLFKLVIGIVSRNVADNNVYDRRDSAW